MSRILLDDALIDQVLAEADAIHATQAAECLAIYPTRIDATRIAFTIQRSPRLTDDLLAYLAAHHPQLLAGIAKEIGIEAQS